MNCRIGKKINQENFYLYAIEKQKIPMNNDEVIIHRNSQTLLPINTGNERIIFYHNLIGSVIDVQVYQKDFFFLTGMYFPSLFNRIVSEIIFFQ